MFTNPNEIAQLLNNSSARNYVLTRPNLASASGAPPPPFSSRNRNSSTHRNPPSTLPPAR